MYPKSILEFNKKILKSKRDLIKIKKAHKNKKVKQK